MKEAVLMALADKWMRIVKGDEKRDGHEDAKLKNAHLDGINEGMLRCHDDMVNLIELLGE